VADMTGTVITAATAMLQLENIVRAAAHKHDG
jgi:hypothetical protein